MANAGVPPQGWNSSEVARLQTALGVSSGEGALQNPYGYSPKDEEYYSNIDPEKGLYYVSPEAPARLTDIPTSSIDASRPRTVAAGYDESRGVMTVVFRDGTVYNYYSVTKGEWLNFKNSVSKGRPWLNKTGVGAPGLFIGKPQGPADMSGVDPEVQSEIYLTAATAQQRFRTRYRYKTGQVQAGKPVAKQRVAKSGAKRAGLNPNSRAAKGGNPAKNKGKNPN